MAEERSGIQRWGIGQSTVIQLVVWIAAVMLAYGALTERISVLEANYSSLSFQLQKLDQKLDRLLERPR